MADQDGALQRVADWVRRRIPLEVVGAAEATGVMIPSNPGRFAAYRGGAGTDYACGRCGSLLCIGVEHGMFRSLVFECGCGALNKVR